MFTPLRRRQSAEHAVNHLVGHYYVTDRLIMLRQYVDGHCLVSHTVTLKTLLCSIHIHTLAEWRHTLPYARMVVVTVIQQLGDITLTFVTGDARY